MHVLNVIVKQTMTMKTQNAIFSYVEILKMKLNSIVKAVFKQIKHEIIILQYQYLFLNEEEIKSTKIMKTMNTKIENNNKKKMIIVRKLSSENIILMLNLTKTKNHMIKKLIK